jgi:hypothetical protein
MSRHICLANVCGIPATCGAGTSVPAREQSVGPRLQCGAGKAVLLTKAIDVLSGDQDGTLMVPCPPYT